MIKQLISWKMPWRKNNGNTDMKIMVSACLAGNNCKYDGGNNRNDKVLNLMDGSVWFPGFIDYMKAHAIHAGSIYLSLGDREEKTRNPVMATVGERIREAHELLLSVGTECILEWNKGNHFKDADIRTAKAFAWLMNRGKENVLG